MNICIIHSGFSRVPTGLSCFYLKIMSSFTAKILSSMLFIIHSASIIKPGTVDNKYLLNWGLLLNDYCAYTKTSVNISKQLWSKLKRGRASLVAQWLRICLLMQEARVRALVWEDPTCHGAAGPVSHGC